MFNPGTVIYMMYIFGDAACRDVKCGLGGSTWKWQVMMKSIGRREAGSLYGPEHVLSRWDSGWGTW